MAIMHPLDWALITGPVPAATSAIAGLAAGYLLFLPRRPRAARVTAALLAGAGALTAGAAWFVADVWRPFPDALPAVVCIWVGVAVAALLLAVGKSRPHGRRSAAAAVVLLGCAVGVNAYYGQYPTVRGAIGLPLSGLMPFTEAIRQSSGTGHLTSADIPGTTSGFRARPALIWVPPNYHREPPPVLILLAGQPGQPADLFVGGRLAEVLEAYARGHGGHAPIVVVPDDLGATLANPLCLDSRIARADTYLSRDVPAWIRGQLRVAADPARWAVGGYSHGGTCALQLAVTHPDVYPTFIDVSGQREPTLGTRERTVAAAFHGDTQAFTQVNPLDALTRRRLPQVFGVIVAGTDDHTYLPQQQAVRDACRAAGMTVAWVILPGGHTWRVWGPGLATGLDRITGRLGLEQK